MGVLSIAHLLVSAVAAMQVFIDACSLSTVIFHALLEFVDIFCWNWMKNDCRIVHFAVLFELFASALIKGIIMYILIIMLNYVVLFGLCCERRAFLLIFFLVLNWNGLLEAKIFCWDTIKSDYYFPFCSDSSGLMCCVWPPMFICDKLHIWLTLAIHKLFGVSGSFNLSAGECKSR